MSQHPRPTSADQVHYPSQVIELAAPICRLHQLCDGAARAHPDRPGRPSQSSNSGLQSGCQSQSSESAVRVSRPRQPESIVQVTGLSQPSESAVRVSRPGSSSMDPVEELSPRWTEDSEYLTQLRYILDLHAKQTLELTERIIN